VFLVLAQAPGGLSCFLVEGSHPGFQIQRLKDKLGTRSLPSSEVEFHRLPGRIVGEEGRGVPTIIEMVNHTRLDCLLGSAAGMRRALAEAVHHARHRSAFGKLLADPVMGHNRFSGEEVEAVRRVSTVQAQIRNAMSEGSGAAGGFAIPLTLDPSIIITGQGALCPIRQFASVETIGTREWDGVSTDSVTAGYVAEATAATDASPTLAQPNIRTQQGRAVVRASIELFQDWSRIQQEMARLVEDARNTVDASAFLTGFTNSPVGVLAVGFTGGLSTTQRVLSATTNAYAVGDPWLLKAQIPPRFQGNAAFAASPGIWDTTYRFVGGNSTEPVQMPGRGGDMMGRPKFEWSTMTNNTTTAARLMVGGDWKTGFKIIDRLGMTAEIIPHAFDVTNNMPTGERMIYAYWRTGSAVVAPNALRYLEVK